MSSKFFNNTPNSNLFQKFCDIAHQMCNFHTFQAVVGYFRSSGYFKLRAEFENVKKIQILVGIDVDKLFRKQSEFFFGLKIDENAIREAYSKNFREEIKEANYAETEKGILQFCDDICSGKLEIRIHKSKDLHAKFYLLLPENHTESSDGWVIMGSSNLSDSGLGTKDDNNRYELNVAMKDYDDVNYCKEEFQKLWADALPLSLDDMRNMKNQTHLTDDFDKPKIIYPETTVGRSQFYYDDSKFMLDKTCFFISGEKLKFLEGMLTSKIIEWYLERMCRLLGKRTIQYSKQWIEDIPIASPNEKQEKDVVEIVDEITDNIKNDSAESQQKINLLIKKLNAKIGEIYNLNEQELDFIGVR